MVCFRLVQPLDQGLVPPAGKPHVRVQLQVVLLARPELLRERACLAGPCGIMVVQPDLLYLQERAAMRESPSLISQGCEKVGASEGSLVSSVFVCWEGSFGGPLPQLWPCSDIIKCVQFLPPSQERDTEAGYSCLNTFGMVLSMAWMNRESSHASQHLQARSVTADLQLEATTHLAFLGCGDCQIRQVSLQGAVSLPHNSNPEPVRLSGLLQQIAHSPAGLGIPEGGYGDEDAL